MNIPKHLTKESKKIYKNLLENYEFNGESDLKTLQVTLEAFDRCQGARQQIQKDGLIIHDRFNTPRAHPLLSVERDSRAAFLAGLKALKLAEDDIRQAGPGSPTAYQIFKKHSGRGSK